MDGGQQVPPATQKKKEMNVIFVEGERPKRTSQELFKHVQSLEKECENVYADLVDCGQLLSAAKAEDAVSGLHKVTSCWNHSID